MNSKGRNDNRWKILVAIFAMCWVFTYGHRMLLSPVLVSIEKEWFLSNTELGLLSSTLFFAYAILQIPAGILADRFGRNNLLIAGLLLQSFAVIGSGLAGNVRTFVIMRLLTGVGQGTLFASLFGLASSNISEKKRTLGLAIIHAGMPLGVVYGLVFSSQLTYNIGFSWRTSFILSGLALFFVTGFIIFYFNRIGSYLRINENNVTKADSPKENISLKLFNRNMVVISLCNFLEAYGIFVIFAWLPYYLTSRGFSELYAGNISSLISLLTIPSTILFALLSVKAGRKKPIIMLQMPISITALLFIVTTEIHWLLITALLVNGLAGKMATGPLHIALISESAGREKISTAFGIYNSMGALAMITGPSITGYLADLTGTIESGLYLAIFFQVVAMAIFYIWVKEKGPVSSISPSGGQEGDVRG